MKEKDIIVTTLISRRDFNILRNYFMYQKKSTRTKVIAAIMLFSFLLLIISTTPYSMPFFKPLGLIGIVVVTLLYCVISFEVRKIELNVKDMVNQTQEVTISDSGIFARWKNSGNSAQYDWTDIESGVETDPYFFLFITNNRALIIPKIELRERLVKDIRETLTKYIQLSSELSGFKANI